MKTLAGFTVTLFLTVLAFAPRVFAIPPPPPNIPFTLISPTAGQILYSGQKVRVEWETSGLNSINCTDCEMELWLSLDGGKTDAMEITPSMDPRATFFYWTVPNTPTNSAVLDIRFGCDLHYPESYAPQPASMFTIAQSGGH